MAKLAGFGVVLGIVLGGGAVVGKAVGPIDSTSDAMDEHGSGNHGEGMDETMPVPGGVTISQDGYTLDADTTLLGSGTPVPFTFRITGPHGSVVREFVERHERELHLVLVGTDLGTYAHLHPSRSDDGTWSVDLPDLAPGVYRAFADFAVADGPELTLGVDVTVAGDATYAPLPPVAATSEVDGYEVALTGSPAADSETEVTVSVNYDGRQVTDLDPYLGAFGHLVAIRAGDLAYLHVHPLGDEPEDVRFAVEVPSPGDYRLFFDFSHDGAVHTAAFTVRVPDASGGHR